MCALSNTKRILGLRPSATAKRIALPMVFPCPISFRVGKRPRTEKWRAEEPSNTFRPAAPYRSNRD